jgi:pyrroline-5-carboxylate reductase
MGFVGAGKLAGSVIRGLIRAKLYSPKEIIASEPNSDARATLQKETAIQLTTENAEVAEKAEVILIGVKPGMVLAVLRDLASFIENKHVISLAAGTRLAAMESIAGARFMRALTNTRRRFVVPRLDSLEAGARRMKMSILREKFSARSAL